MDVANTLMYPLTANFQTPCRLHSSYQPDEAVAVEGAGRTVTVPLAAAWPSLLMLHSRLYELLLSAELPCPLCRLEYVLILTT